MIEDDDKYEEHERRRVSDDELAYNSALETFAYEIGKNRQEIAGLRRLAAASGSPGAAEYAKHIKDAEERIAQLERRYFEVEQQERHSTADEDSW